jgi:hypothetical protein
MVETPLDLLCTSQDWKKKKKHDSGLMIHVVQKIDRKYKIPKVYIKSIPSWRN